MSLSIDAWAAEIAQLRRDPTAVQRIVLQRISEAVNGEFDIVSASTPFVALLESTTALSLAAMTEHENILQAMYPKLARTEDELYRHMSDVDYVGRFATPGKAVFSIAMLVAEIKDKAVVVPDSNVRKLVIPRHTFFTIAGYTFTMQYPIEIRVMPHGGLQVVYNVERPSPLYVPSSNVVDAAVNKTTYGEMLVMEFPVDQFEITSIQQPLSVATGFVREYDLQDQYYYCRAFQSLDGKTWKECTTTHSALVYDPFDLTVVLKLVGNKLKVSIPHIYFSNGKASGVLRLDIYTTKGSINLVFDDYQGNDFVATWVDYDNDENGVYTAPLSTFANMSVWSDVPAVGGTNGIGFTALRERVIKNGTKTGKPITGSQLEVELANRGYLMVKNIDHITRRVYLATRSLPKPRNNNLYAGANAAVDMLAAKMTDLALLPTVRDNGLRITIEPGTLFKYEEGKVAIVGVVERGELLAASAEARANLVNVRDYVFTPFHYVMDSSDNSFDCRGYYLDNPTITRRLMVEENDTAEIEVSTGSYSVERTGTGYRLLVVTTSGKSYQDLRDDQAHCQLSFIPVGESTRAYLTGTLIGKNGSERVFSFNLTSSMDIDRDNNIVLRSFKMFDETPDPFAIALEGEFDLVHLVSQLSSSFYKPSAIDELVRDQANLPVNVRGVIHERLTVKFGTTLNHLWSNSRTVVGENDYLRYAADVPLLYTQNEYERDPATQAIVIPLNLLHAKDDPVMADGQPVMKHRVGEIKLDASGEPILLNPRSLVRQVDLFFLEGPFLFATTANDVAYRRQVAEQVIAFLNEDIAALSSDLLEETELYYYPKRTLGRTKVLVENNTPVYIPATLAFKVRFYLRASVYSNQALRNSLADTAKRVIAEQLQKRTVSLTEISSAIRDALGSDVVPLDVFGLEEAGGITTYTVYDDSAHCSIKRKLQLLPDGTLQVVDDITVEFIRHGE